MRKNTEQEMVSNRAEILDLEGFGQSAVSITEHNEGITLLQALKVAFERLKEPGVAQKAIIFVSAEPKVHEFSRSGSAAISSFLSLRLHCL